MKILTFLLSAIAAFAGGSGVMVCTETECIMRDHALIEKPAMMVIGIECRTSNLADAAPQDIPKLWGKFFEENVLGKIPNKTSDEIVALYCDYEDDHTKPYTVVIGCETRSIDEIPDGMVAKVIPATKYAVYSAKGEHPKALIDTWSHIWETAENRTYTGDFEVYGSKFANDPKEVEVFIAIED